MSRAVGPAHPRANPVWLCKRLRVARPRRPPKRQGPSTLSDATMTSFPVKCV